MLITVAVIINAMGLTASPEPRNRLPAIITKRKKGVPQAMIVRYCVAKSIISGVAPQIVRIGTGKKTAAVRKITPKPPASGKICPARWFVASMFLSPKRREARELMPMPVPAPMAMISIW
jgi:hypothetical protein